jgi:hypothetical protein
MRDLDALTRRAIDLVELLALEDGRRWGDAATPEQRADVAAVLDLRSERRMHWLGRARGYSKTSDTAAMSLAALLVQLPAGAAAYAAAADRDQARLLLTLPAATCSARRSWLARSTSRPAGSSRTAPGWCWRCSPPTPRRHGG